MQLDFEAMFSEYVAETTTKVWGHDRNLTVGASEVFSCIRKVWFRKRGHEFTKQVSAGFDQVQDGVDTVDGIEYPRFVEQEVFTEEPMYPEDDEERSLGAAHRGNLLESGFVVPAVEAKLPKDDKVKMMLGGAEQKTFFHNRNSATPDGLIIGLPRDALAKYGIPDIGTHCILLEIKTVDPRVRLKEAKPIHVGQAQAQMGVLRTKTPYAPNYTVVLYVDASFLDVVKPFVVKFDQDAWDAAQARANLVYEVSDPLQMPPEGKQDGECEHCEFYHSCAVVTTGGIPDDDTKSISKNAEVVSEFDVLAREHDQAQAAKNAAEKSYELIRTKVKDALMRHKTRKINGKKFKMPWNVSWYSQQGNLTLSKELLTEALGTDDLTPYMKQGAPFDVLRVSFGKETAQPVVDQQEANED